jgi:outer membrane protein assembly factor BamE
MSTDPGAWPSVQRLRSHYALAGIFVVTVLLEACAYRIDIQQGNLLEEEALDQIQLGMSRSAVQFLLGTPMVADAFHEQRWDYAYYFRRGRAREVEQRWIVVYFEQDRVVRIERDLELRPSG